MDLPAESTAAPNSLEHISSTRQRESSVTFAHQTSQPRPESEGSYRPMASRAQLDRRRLSEEAESSADEASAILRKQRGPSKSASLYGAVGSSRDGVNEEPLARGDNNTDSLRQRKPPAQEPSPSATAHPGSSKQGWFKSFVEKYGSVELENKGSVARDHLALERTFLAWLRTSLSFASIGVAITQLFRLNTATSGQTSNATQTTGPLSADRLKAVGKPLGATFLGISILILLIGFHRYFESQHYVIRGKFPASRGSIIMVSFLATALIIASLVVVLAIAPAAFET